MNLNAISTHGPCNEQGLAVKDNLPQELDTQQREWILSRLEAGELKYGTVLSLGWSKSKEALLEELADAIAYATALNHNDTHLIASLVKTLTYVMYEYDSTTV